MYDLCVFMCVSLFWCASLYRNIRSSDFQGYRYSSSCFMGLGPRPLLPIRLASRSRPDMTAVEVSQWGEYPVSFLQIVLLVYWVVYLLLLLYSLYCCCCQRSSFFKCFENLSVLSARRRWACVMLRAGVSSGRSGVVFATGSSRHRHYSPAAGIKCWIFSLCYAEAYRFCLETFPRSHWMDG